MSCLSVQMKRVPDGMKVMMDRNPSGMIVKMTTNVMKARMGLVCGTSLGDYAILWVQDGALMTVDNQYLLVKKVKRHV